MKWKKLGKIFNPHEHSKLNDFIGYAQSPQTLVLSDRIRVYFSTRKKDGDCFLSHVKYVEFSFDFSKIIDISDHNVVELGSLGCFDEHGIFPFNVFENNNEIHAYSTGWSRRSAVSVETGIGYLRSKDGGVTYEKYGNGPIVTSSLHEPFLVCDAFVRAFDETLYMYYIYGNRWKVYNEMGIPERTYVIAMATSVDGIHWEKFNQPIIATETDDECQALPTVIKINETYHMFFCYRSSIDFRSNKNNGYKIGYAKSNDLFNWERNDLEGGLFLSLEGWDSEMMCYPHIFKVFDQIYLLYNGNQFGKEGFGLARLVEV